RPPRSGGVQRDDTDTFAARFGHALLRESASQAAPAILRLDKEIQHIAAMLALRIQNVRSPIEHHQASRGDGAIAIACDPSGVFALAQHALDPWLKFRAHRVESRLM